MASKTSMRIALTTLFLLVLSTAAGADGSRAEARTREAPRVQSRSSPPPTSTRAPSPPPPSDRGTAVAPGSRSGAPRYVRPPAYRSGHGSHGYRSYYPHYPSYPYYDYGPYYPYYPYYRHYPYYPWWPTGFWFGYWSLPMTTTETVATSGGPTGALDLDISPEEARVIVDGELLGSCDDYDGNPDFLWLPEGSYEIHFYNEGYRTETRRVEVVSGTVQTFDFSLERGEAVMPELGPLGEAPRAEIAASRVTEGETPARLRLEISPPDASVYLDGRFLGTGDELSMLHSGLALEPGRHLVQVVRPGRIPEERVVSVESGEESVLRVELGGS